jgi:hypothetical protein
MKREQALSLTLPVKKVAKKVIRRVARKVVKLRPRCTQPAIFSFP